MDVRPSLRQGIDFLIAASADAESPYFGWVDTTRVAAMGHSQGGLGASNAAADARVQAAILFNGGGAADKPFFALSGDFDIGGGTDSSSLFSSVTRAPAAAALWYHQIPETGSASGHLTLMVQPERVVEPALHWLRYMLQGDTESRAWFVGADCTLCNRDEDFEYVENGLR